MKIKDIIIIIVLVILIRTLIITPAKVNGDSMEDTLFDGDIVIQNIIGTKINKISRFDIVVIKSNKELLVKRVIGLPNESIEYKDNILYINGLEVDTMEFENTKDFMSETKKDEYFVLGDNRDISKDSREFGVINKKDIEGKVNFIIFPFKKFGFIK